MQDTPLDDAELVVASVGEELMRLPALDTLFFGHSLGALVALRVLQNFTPLRFSAELIVSACNAPHVKKLVEGKSTLGMSDDEFIDRVREFNGTSPDILNSPALLDLFMPMLRADFRLAEMLRDLPWGDQLVPIRVFFGSRDDEVTQDGLVGWKRYSTGSPAFYSFDGGHFYVNSHVAEVCRLIVSK